MAENNLKIKEKKGLKNDEILALENELFETIKNSKNYTDMEKNFILTYYQTDSIYTTKTLLNIADEDLILLYNEPKVIKAIKELKEQKALRIFKRKMLTLDELGTIVSNQLLDLDITENQKLDGKGKLDAAKIIIEIHKAKNDINNKNIIDHPILDAEIVANESIESKLNSLNVNELKQLLNKKEDEKDKKDLKVIKQKTKTKEISKLNKTILKKEKKEKETKEKEAIKKAKEKLQKMQMAKK